MQAVHINWTKPFFVRNGGEYFIEDFEILTTFLSALKWREKNGSIKMITDSTGAAYYSKLGMADLWDNGIEISLDDITEDPYMFWAAGKLHALKAQKAPVAVIDTDFIVWEEILFDALPSLAVIHDEPLYKDVYPNVNHFRMRGEYGFDPSWNWKRNALNTAFYVIKDNKLLNYYTTEAIRFMACAEPTDDPLTYMVFAEQRLLGMCAERIGAEVTEFSTLERLFRNGEGWFTHIWGMKQQMRDIPELRHEFCKRCIRRILNDYPEREKTLRGIKPLEKYMSRK